MADADDCAVDASQSRGRDLGRLFRAILDVTSALGKSEEGEGAIEKVLQESFSEAVAAFGAQKALLLSIDPDSATRRVLYSSGLKSAQIDACQRGESIKGVSSSIIRKAIDTRSTQIVEHPSLTRPADQTDALTGEDYSVLCGPVLGGWRNAVIAVCYFQHNGGPDFSKAYRQTDAVALSSYLSVLEGTLGAYLERERLEKRLHEMMQGPRPTNAPDIIGSSHQTEGLRRLLRQTYIPACDQTEPRPVLVLGESGTGKDLVARFIHGWSSRHSKRFVALNCADIGAGFERAQFAGHVAGSFTGAGRDERGAFRAADGGVLFLDEIGELSLEAQGALLRVLDEFTVMPVGSSTPISVDVFVVLATNRPLDDAVKEGRIKHDFLARFSAQAITLTPLRERRQDIPELAVHMIRAREQKARKRTLGLSPGAMRALRSYDWPHNVRELRDTCDHLVTRVKPGQLIDEQVLAEAYPDIAAAVHAEPSFAEATQDFQRQLILSRHEMCGRNHRETYTSLRMKRATFYHRLSLLELTLPDRNA